MRKTIAMLLTSMLILGITACGNNDHTGEAKTPSGSSAMKGRMYTDVIEIFEEKGFTNIKTEKTDDLVLGWLSKEGEVKEVAVGGDTEYTSDKWMPADTEVIIRYHTFPESTNEVDGDTSSNTDKSDDKNGNTDPSETKDKEVSENSEDATEDAITLNVDNCPELNEILSMKAEIDDKYAAFASKYEGRTIEFDGRIDYCTHHDEYKTRFDYLVSAGDYDPDHQIGPTFKFENVNYHDLHTDIDEVTVGLNVHIVAEVKSFNSSTGLFFLEPVSITER